MSYRMPPFNIGQSKYGPPKKDKDDKRTDAEKLEAGRKRREIEERLEDKALDELISDELESEK